MVNVVIIKVENRQMLRQKYVLLLLTGISFDFVIALYLGDFETFYSGDLAWAVWYLFQDYIFASIRFGMMGSIEGCSL